MTLTAAIVVGPVLLAVGLASLVFFIVTLVDMTRRPSWLWVQAGSNKTLWIVLEVICFVLLSLLSIVIGVLYYSMIRPRLVIAESQSRSGYGPGGYGPGGYGPGGSTPPPPGYGPAPGAPWSPYPPPRETTEEPPAGPPPYPGGGPPPYPGSTPGSATGAAAPSGVSPAYPSAGGYPAAPQYSNPPFGWYPDPSHHHEQRYWDGTRWTEYVSDGGQQSTEPLPD